VELSEQSSFHRRSVHLESADKSYTRTFSPSPLQNSKNGIAVGSRGTVLITTNGGVDWKERKDMRLRFFRRHVYIHRTRAVVVGYSGTIVQTDDSGETWKRIESLVTTDLFSVTFTDDLHGWAAGHGGVVLTTGDGGNIWLPVNVRTAPRLGTVFFADESLGWAAGADVLCYEQTTAACRGAAYTRRPRRSGKYFFHR
jgi:photosystem II stability/assembly factor-like uncharacterized protein